MILNEIFRVLHFQYLPYPIPNVHIGKIFQNDCKFRGNL